MAEGSKDNSPRMALYGLLRPGDYRSVTAVSMTLGQAQVPSEKFRRVCSVGCIAHTNGRLRRGLNRMPCARYRSAKEKSRPCAS